jgi:L-ascorbate metabolism protein UlaG (beta-lactamase superfamily)
MGYVGYLVRGAATVVTIAIVWFAGWVKMATLRNERKRAWAPLVSTVSLLGLVVGAGCVSPTTTARFSERSLPVGETVSPHARFFGVSTILLADQSSGILIDGFFSRPSISGLFTGFNPNPKRIEEAFSDGRIEKLRAILVAHPHHDHALDAATIAAGRNIPLYGSALTARIVKRQQPRFQKFLPISDRQVVERCGFTITCIETPHAESPWPIGLVERLTFFPGVGDFPFDTNFSFHVAYDDLKILIVTSAALPRKSELNLSADITFLSIGYLARQGEQAIKRYWCEYVKKPNSKYVIPIHWDNLMGSLRDGLQPIPWPVDNVSAALDILQQLAKADGVKIAFMPLQRPVSLRAILAEP